jgi:Ran GTPase-activating protein (RanGAP) involved in mRNA processing and transport
MDRFSRIVPLLRRNDPIINCINMSLIELTDDMTAQLVEALNNNTFICKLVLQENRISLASCKRIFDLLLSHPKLNNLEITDNQLGDDALEYLSRILCEIPPNRELISLTLRKNAIGPAGAGHLAHALERNVPVHWLDLRYNSGITDCGVARLALALPKNTHLGGLDLIQSGCGDSGAFALADALSENATVSTLLLQDMLSLSAVHSLGTLLASPSCRLESLYLWSCALNDKIDVLCRSLRDNRSISTLALSYNKINDQGGLFLSDMILRNRSIVKLHLGANRFTPQTTAYLGVALGKNSTITFLDLSRNDIRSVGVWPLAVSLMGNKALRSIDLRYNRIDQAAGEMLCELISGGSAITSVRLSGNHFGDQTVALLAERLKTNPTLRELELNDVEMSSAGFAALCRALRVNQTLEKISLGDNPIESNVLEAFTELLRENAALTNIGMWGFRIDVVGCRYIADGLVANSTLSELDLSKNNINLEGLGYLLDALVGNYCLMRIEWGDNAFADDAASQTVTTQIQDILERNNYYLHNILMRDMAALVRDPAML